MMKVLRKAKLVIFILFVVICFSRMFAQIIRVPILDLAGFVSGFSPLPLVFSNKEGFEDFTSVVKFSYQDKSGDSVSQIVDQNTLKSITGPIYRAGGYGIALNYAYRFPEELWYPTVKYLLCDSSILFDKNLMDKKDPIVLSAKVLKEKEWLLWSKEIKCTK